MSEFNTALFVFKSIKGIIHSSIEFNEREATTYNLRETEHLIVPFTRSSQSKRFVYINGANVWNRLPADLRAPRTLYTFKRKLKVMYLNIYGENNG